MQCSAIAVVLCAATAQAHPQPETLVADPNVERIVEYHLQTDPRDAMLNLKYLCIRSAAISTLAGIENARNLVSVRIYNSRVEDIRDLAHLGKLKELHIRNCRIPDLSVVSRLRSLQNLVLTDMAMEDLSCVAGCSDLSYLNVSSNRLSSLTGVESLTKLSRLDASDNPLNEDSCAALIHQIKTRKPSLQFSHGPTHTLLVSQSSLLEARATMAETGCLAKWQVIEGIVRPLLPALHEEQLAAIKLLEHVRDEDYLADVAAVLVRYADATDRNYAPSTLMSRYDPHHLLMVFLLRMQPGPLGDEITSQAVGKWISNNRHRFAPSTILDEEIKNHKATLEWLDRKYLVSPAKTSEMNGEVPAEPAQLQGGSR